MKAFVFDLAGVLVTWDPALVYLDKFNGDKKAMNEFFKKVLDDDWQKSMDAGKSIAQAVSERCAAFPEHTDLIKLVETNFEQMFGDELGGTVSVMEELLEREKPVYALGNWSREAFNLAREKYAFLDNFTDVLLSGDLGILKPDPRIFQEAIHRWSLVPEETVYIDDRIENAEAAVALGFNGLHFTNARELYLVLMEYGIL